MLEAFRFSRLWLSVHPFQLHIYYCAFVHKNKVTVLKKLFWENFTCLAFIQCIGTFSFQGPLCLSILFPAIDLKYGLYPGAFKMCILSELCFEFHSLIPNASLTPIESLTDMLILNHVQTVLPTCPQISYHHLLVPAPLPSLFTISDMAPPCVQESRWFLPFLTIPSTMLNPSTNLFTWALKNMLGPSIFLLVQATTTLSRPWPSLALHQPHDTFPLSFLCISNQ